MYMVPSSQCFWDDKEHEELSNNLPSDILLLFFEDDEHSFNSISNKVILQLRWPSKLPLLQIKSIKSLS